jgi:hypothetical protein
MVMIRRDAGLYLVTLNNDEPISVNANDPRIADKCIRVTRANCKFGKAKRLTRRCDNYGKVFGVENVNFKVVAFTDDIGLAERLVLKALSPWCIRGPTGRKNEWLEGIAPTDVERIAFGALHAAGLVFALPDTVTGT